MAGLTKDAPTPTEILLHQKSRVLEIAFSDGKRFRMPCEFLRVYSPSAEVRGHGPGQEVLQVGKKNVEIVELDPVGHVRRAPGILRRTRYRHLLVGLFLHAGHEPGRDVAPLPAADRGGRGESRGRAGGRAPASEMQVVRRPVVE